MACSIDSLEIADNPVVLFRGIVGRRAYGTQNANSDTDVRGIFVVPSAAYARLAQPPKLVSTNATKSPTSQRGWKSEQGGICIWDW